MSVLTHVHLHISSCFLNTWFHLITKICPYLPDHLCPGGERKMWTTDCVDRKEQKTWRAERMLSMYTKSAANSKRNYPGTSRELKNEDMYKYSSCLPSHPCETHRTEVTIFYLGTCFYIFILSVCLDLLPKSRK